MGTSNSSTGWAQYLFGFVELSSWICWAFVYVLVSFSNIVDTVVQRSGPSDDINGAQEPLLNGNRPSENYSTTAAILP